MRQAGAALLMMVAILATGVMSFMISSLNSAALNQSTAGRHHNAAVLAEAKAALIGYVAKEVLDLSENVPGRLPCPESPSDAGGANEGRAGSACSPTFPTNKNIGRLPWRTLGISKLVDAASEPLWFAVSPNWVLSTPNPPPVINAGSQGQLTVDGVADVVAIIIAPGRALSVNPSASQLAQGCVARQQARSDRAHGTTWSVNPDYRDYLECANATSPVDTTFGTAIVDNATNPVINDQVITIRAKELLNAIQGPVSERLQRTVAPLLSEYSDTWISGAKFMPYAVAFSPPEAGLATSSHCGTSGHTEGLLPIAPTTSFACGSTWTGSFSGDGITSMGCDGASPATCSFRYYRLSGLGQLVFGSAGAASLTATLQAVAPHAAASFRAKSVQTASDVTVTTGAATLGSFAIAPKTNGDVEMSFQASVSSTNLCKESLIGGVLCSAVAAFGLASSSTVSVQFAQLGSPRLAGSKLTTAARNGRFGPYDLLTPVSGEPHYWFIQNEWYRYTYYAVAPGTSAAQSGGTLTVSLFPVEKGSPNDKRFVLALMGPALTGQTRNATAALGNYVEGVNAATTALPRVFAYQLYASSGNDRIATCPFNDGTTTPCD